MIDISIVIPAYNIENYISRSLDSIINQGFQNFEVLVVNDGSKDNTEKIVRAYEDRDTRIKLINKPNGGVSSARNLGLKKSTGKYIMFIDGDDWIEPKTLESLYKRVEEEEADIALCDFYYDYDNEKLEYATDLKVKNIKGKDYAKKILTEEAYMCIWNKVFKRDIFLKNHIDFPEDISLGEDFITLVKIALNVNKVVKVDEAFIHYIQREGSITKVLNNKVYGIFNAIDNLSEYLKTKGIYDEFKEEIEMARFLHTFYYRVMGVNDPTDIHKELYNRWASWRNEIKSNKYYNDYIRKMDKKTRFRFYMLNFNYPLAINLFKIKSFLFNKK
ncbi:glycosyltransferase family 2 protein [Clostridium sp.]|uniref:glycosyltransferase family 2 protein n=1 Tax=Clostridium sp. TaxID=1506 RepID=UPI0034642D31